MSLACVLISDVTGSTALFERMENAEALATVDAVMERMRDLVGESGGHCVRAKGDDVLSFFETSTAAFQAAWAMIHEPWVNGVAIHAGIYFGEILSHDNDIYGNAVNTAARLASLAKSGEILLGECCFADLTPEQQQRCLDIGALPLRGKEAPTRVYACSVQKLGEQTLVRGLSPEAPPKVFAAFTQDKRHWHLEEGGTLNLGRAPDNDIVLDSPSVSRNHGALTIRSGQLEFTDRSSAGSLVRMANGTRLAVHRRTTLLSGAGEIVLGGEDAAQPAVLVFSLGELDAR